jgi:hypothetical protein
MGIWRRSAYATLAGVYNRVFALKTLWLRPDARYRTRSRLCYCCAGLSLSKIFRMKPCDRGRKRFPHQKLYFLLSHHPIAISRSYPTSIEHLD